LTQEASSQGMPPPNQLEVLSDFAGVKTGQIYGLGMESSVLAGRPHYLVQIWIMFLDFHF